MPIPPTSRSADRLVEIAIKQGRSERVAELRRERSETALARGPPLPEMFDRNQPQRDAAEMGQLAERLGRNFEARAYLTVAVSVDPERSDLQRSLAILQERSENRSAPARTLADLLAAEFGAHLNNSGRLTPEPVHP